MNGLKIFENITFGTVRTTEQNGQPYFCLADVCRILEIRNISDCKSRLGQKGVVITDTLTNGGTQQMTFINESNLYKVIFQSRKPEAEKFVEWITGEVIPTIRKTGGYVNDESQFINTYLPYADDQTRQMFSATLQTIRSLNSKIEQDKPKVMFADAIASSKTSILIGDLAKLLRQNGVEIGQNRLFQWLRDNDYLMKHGDRRNLPTQYAMERELFEVKERTFENVDGSVRITRTTKVTPKAQQYFVNKFLGA